MTPPRASWLAALAVAVAHGSTFDCRVYDCQSQFTRVRTPLPTSVPLPATVSPPGLLLQTPLVPFATNALGHAIGYAYTGSPGNDGFFFFDGTATTFRGVGFPYAVFDVADNDVILYNVDDVRFRLVSPPIDTSMATDFGLLTGRLPDGAGVEYRSLRYQAMNSDATLFRMIANANSIFTGALLERDVQFLYSRDANFAPSPIPEPWTAPMVGVLALTLGVKARTRIRSGGCASRP